MVKSVTSANAPPAVVWDVMSRGDAFSHRSKFGPIRVFSKDSRNAASVHSYKYSPLAQSKTLAVAVQSKLVKTKVAHQVVLLSKTGTGKTQVDHLSRNPKKAAASIVARVDAAYYRCVKKGNEVEAPNGGRCARVSAVSPHPRPPPHSSRPDLKAVALGKLAKLRKATSAPSPKMTKVGRKREAVTLAHKA